MKYKEPEIIIPELEKLMGTGPPSNWTGREDALLTRYYRNVPRDALLKALPGRTWSAVTCRAYAIGLTKRGRGG